MPSIFAISDVHTDFQENIDWIQRLAPRPEVRWEKEEA
jgi:hypothetical protein